VINVFARTRAAAGLLLAAAIFCTAPVHGRTATGAPSEIAASDLPKEGREVLDLIRSGGPFHYERDGVVFGNREHRLPAEPRGYYHEYTVRTPGSRSRGARRIICGGPKQSPTDCYYTADHYRSFKRIRE
jgi:ribonuclease T1